MKHNIYIPKKITKDLFFQTLIILFHSLIILKNILGVGNGLFPTIITAGYVSLGISMTLYMIPRISKSLIIFMGSMLLLSIITAIFSENYRINDVLLVFTYFGIALIPIYFKLNYKLFLLFAYCVIIFFVISFFRVNNPNKVFATVSRNNISVTILIVMGYYIITCFQNKRKPNFLLIVLSFIFAVWGEGRSGILSIGLLFVFYPFFTKTTRKYKLFFSLFLFILLVVVYQKYFDVFQSIFQRFYEVGIDTTGRSKINREYIERVSFSISHLFFGVPLNEIPSLVNQIGLVSDSVANPHNSFIRAHVYYGFGGFLLLVIFLIYTLFHFFRTKNFIFFIMLLALLIRSSFDSTAFHGPLDTIIYFFVFYAIKETILIHKSTN